MSNNEDEKKYLYHYTNIDSLALILKNKNIRLNSLDRMDDLQEQMSNDKQNFGKFVFISSWTADDNESIPMWRMYTPKQRGVRIKLPANPFVEYTLTLAEVAAFTNSTVQGDSSSCVGFKTVVPAKDIFSAEFSLTNYMSNNQLFEVKYTDNENLLKPTLLETIDSKFMISLNNIGIYKNKYWSFQNEWRYRLMFLPMSTAKLVQEHMQGKNDEMAKLQLRTIYGQASLSFNYFDLFIRDECFSDMSVMLAPDISDSSKIFVQLLIKEYNRECNIEDSALTKLIK